MPDPTHSSVRVERRRSPRVAARLPVRLGLPPQEALISCDLSAYGVSVEAAQARSEGEYVELEVDLPGESVPLSATAIVVRKGRWEGLQGLAFCFRRLSVEDHVRWCRCLRRLDLAHRGLSEDGIEPSFLIHPRDTARLRRLLDQEIALGRMQLEGGAGEPVGCTAKLILVHPDTGEEWQLSGVVCGARPHAAGVKLDLLLPPLDAAERAAFSRFIDEGLAPLSLGSSIASDLTLEVQADAVELVTARPDRADRALPPLSPRITVADQVSVLLASPEAGVDGAEALAQRAIQTHPGSFEAHLALAQVRCRQGRYAEAYSALQRAHALGLVDPPRALSQLIELGRGAEPAALERAD